VVEDATKDDMNRAYRPAEIKLSRIPW